jgi:hypothetical protein
MIQRWGYLSQIVFSSDADLDFLSPALQSLNAGISSALSEIHNRSFDYRTASVSLSVDRAIMPSPIAAFTIERRTDTPFSQNRYFSTAPLPTDKHIELIDRYEWDLMSAAGKI